MLQDEDFEDEFVVRAVERIEEESIKMNKLVEKLLMISREEALVQAYSEEININEMIRRIIEAFHNQIKDNLFEPFIKGNNRNREISSSGLGLYICKRLCEKNSFKIEYFIEKNVIEFIIYFKKYQKEI